MEQNNQDSFIEFETLRKANRFILAYKLYYISKFITFGFTIFLLILFSFLWIYIHQLKIDPDVKYAFLGLIIITALISFVSFKSAFIWKKVYQRVKNYEYFNSLTRQQVNVIIDEHYWRLLWRSHIFFFFMFGLLNGRKEYVDILQQKNKLVNEPIIVNLRSYFIGSGLGSSRAGYY